MCMAIYQGIGKVVKPELIDKFSKSNNDGFGFAYIDNDNKLIIKKTIVFADFIKDYNTACIEFGATSPMLIHFRMGTSGLDSQENCHPFYVSPTTCFIHNGVFSDFTKRDSDFSDTYNFNTDVLSKIKDDLETNIAIQTMIDDMCGVSNKLVFLNNKKEYQIYNEQLGMWEDGIWYSNKSATWISSYPSYGNRSFDYGITDSDWDNSVYGSDKYYSGRSNIISKNKTYKETTKEKDKLKDIHTCVSCGNPTLSNDNIMLLDNNRKRYFICSDCVISKEIRLTDIIDIDKFMQSIWGITYGIS